MMSPGVKSLVLANIVALSIAAIVTCRGGTIRRNSDFVDRIARCRDRIGCGASNASKLVRSGPEPQPAPPRSRSRNRKHHRGQRILRHVWASQSACRPDNGLPSSLPDIKSIRAETPRERPPPPGSIVQSPPFAPPIAAFRNLPPAAEFRPEFAERADDEARRFIRLN